MDDRTLELAHNWLKKAGHDLANARIVSGVPQGPLDTAVYHCQQAAEKAVKALLTARGIPFEKTHDIAKLLGQVVALEPGLARLEDAAEELTPYAVIYRYPGEQSLMEPTVAEMESALKAAEEFLESVKRLLPEAPGPNS